MKINRLILKLIISIPHHFLDFQLGIITVKEEREFSQMSSVNSRVVQLFEKRTYSCSSQTFSSEMSPFIVITENYWQLSVGAVYLFIHWRVEFYPPNTKHTVIIKTHKTLPSLLPPFASLILSFLPSLLCTGNVSTVTNVYIQTCMYQNT